MMGDKNSGKHHEMKPNEELQVGTWNVNGLGSLATQMCEDIQLDILAVSETHSKAEKVRNGWFLAEPVSAGDSFGGVGLFIGERLRNRVIFAGSNGSRIAYCKIAAKPADLFVIAVYMPVQGRSNPDQESCYLQLRETLERVPTHDIVIILGDFNSRLERSSEGVGKWCIHKQSDRGGRMLSSIIHEFGLSVASTYFQPKHNHCNATYLHKGNGAPSQIDYMLISKRWKTNVLSCRVKWGITELRYGRKWDHGMLQARLRLKVRQVRRQRKYDVSLLQTDPEILKAFERRLVGISKQQDSWHQCKQQIKKAMMEIPTIQFQPRRQWWLSASVRQCLEERRQRYEHATNDQRKCMERNLAKLRRQEWRRFCEQAVKQMEVENSKGNVRGMHSIVAQLCGKKQASRVNISRDTEGNLITSEEQRLQCWANFLTRKFAAGKKLERTSEKVGGVAEATITPEEFDMALREMRTGKAVGADGIPIEVVKYSVHAREAVRRVVSRIWEREVFPAEFTTSIIIPIHKKGDPNCMDNYRTIFPTATLYEANHAHSGKQTTAAH